jgi:hypothetical protein
MTHPPGWSGGSDGKVASQQVPSVQASDASSDKSQASRVSASSKQQNGPRSVAESVAESADGFDTWPSLCPPHPSANDTNAHDTQPIPITRIIAKAWTVPVPPASPAVPNWFMKALTRLLGGFYGQ